MTVLPSIALYDPRRLSEQDFLTGFIARQELADFLLNQLRRIAEGGEARHRLILGQRGMGKTSLLRRLEIGIRQDPALNAAFLPLTFREEQYNVRTLDRFWRNCGEALAEWMEAHGSQDDSVRLDAAMEGPEWRDPDRAGESFLSWIAGTKRRAVLLVDNFDLILGALPPDEHWKLRRVLQAARGPVLFAAATQAPRETGDRNAAFYEFFSLDTLDRLTEAELMQCLRRLATARGEAGRAVIDILDRDPARLRVLHTLTGGNPRILALLYQLLERAESETVFTDLEVLLDQMTPLYKARVEELRTELQRSILDAIALHWDPITSNAVARATGLEVTTVSSQLSRLREFGLIEEVSTSGARAGYQLVERFFNVWYLMRHGTRRTRQRLRWLTAFLRTFYAPDDLHRLRDRLGVSPNGLWQEMYATALDEALRHHPGSPSAKEQPGHLRQDDDGALIARAELWRTVTDQVKNKQYTEAEAALREAFRISPEDPAIGTVLGFVLERALNKPEEAEQVYREVLRVNPDAALNWWSLAMFLSRQPARAPEAVEALRSSLDRVPTDRIVWVTLGNVLTDFLARHAEAEQAYQSAMALEDQPNELPAGNLCWLHLRTGRTDQARELRRALQRIAPVGVSLLDAGLDIVGDNFGAATTHLSQALEQEMGTPDGISYHDDLLRLLRLFHRGGYGERLIAWFEETGHHHRQAPIYAAFVAFVRGESRLLDVNPEVRAPAQHLYNWLVSDQPKPPQPEATIPRRRRGRPRRPRISG